MIRNVFHRVAHLFNTVAILVIFALALLVFFDVLGRFLFGQPIRGTHEIVANLVVGFFFLQLPFGIFTGSMVRATVLLNALAPIGRRVANSVNALIGIIVFAVLAYATWSPLKQAIEVGAYEGEGVLRVPQWPVLLTIVLMGALAAVSYLFLLIDALVGSHDRPGGKGRHS
jgi:TRAP-type C4-dicarboxylate transport system permease small subunit